MTKIKASTICLLLFAVYCVLNSAVAAQQPWRVVTELAPPYQSMTDGKLVGISVQRVQPVLTAAGIDADIEVFPWARAFELAQNRKNTLIFSIVRLKERESRFQWIGLIEETHLSFITLAENENVFINSIDDAKRYGIGAVRNDFNHRYLLSQGFNETEHFILRSNLSELLDLMIKGRIEVMLVNLKFLTQILQAKGLTPDDIQVHLEPKNAVRDVYLAAHIDSDKEMVETLRQLFNQ